MLIAVLTLTLGIGANTAIFSVVKTVLLNPLPYDDPEQIVVLWETNPEGGLDQVSIPTFLDWQRETQSLGSVAAYRQTDVSYAGGDKPRDVPALRATPELFDVLAAGARVGGTFVAEEATMGADRVVVLSHRFWEESLGGRQGVVGTTLVLAGEAHNVVGIRPRCPLPRALPDALHRVSRTQSALPVGRSPQTARCPRRRAGARSPTRPCESSAPAATFKRHPPAPTCPAARRRNRYSVRPSEPAAATR